jgi:lipopolysaccharide export system protein LptA
MTKLFKPFATLSACGNSRRICAVISFLLFTAALAFAQSSPLIMYHADNLEVARKRGTLLLTGNVHFVHDSVAFKTQRASWNRNSETVECGGGFLFTHPSGFVRARNGSYQRKSEIAIASGEVSAGDSAGNYLMTGQYLKYDRKEDIVTIPMSPRLYQYEKQKNGTIDTVTIQSRSLIFDKKNSFAQAFQDVKLTQKDLVVTCDTGYFNRKDNWLSMKGHPTCDMKNYHLTGDSIFLVLDETGKMLKSALVIRNAHGIQNEEPKRGNPGNVTEAFGDTLYCEFKKGKIERLYVNLNAKGFFYETDLKEYRNLMDGDRLDLYFKKGRMDRAVVSGKAQSTYFYVKKDRTVSGKNEATGDTIHILFDAQKNAVKSLRLMGNKTNASGRYIDLEKANRIKENAKRDSLAKLDSLFGKELDMKKAKTKADSAYIQKSLNERKLRNLFNRRKDKAKQAEEAKPADETKTEEAQ